MSLENCCMKLKYRQRFMCGARFEIAEKKICCGNKSF